MSASAAQRSPKRVVVIGGGFGGTRAVERLARRDARDRVDVTLIDRTNHHAFAPLLYQVATAGLSPQDVAHSLRAMNARRRHVRVRLAEVQAVDLDRRHVVLDDGVVPYDHLILAPGAVTSDYGVPGVAEHAWGLKTVKDAVAIRNHVLTQFERTAGEGADGALTIVVAGGGATGVELAGAMAELAQGVIRSGGFPELAGGRVRVVLVERADALLSGFVASSQEYTRHTLERAGVEVRLGTAIRRVHADRLELDDGSVIATSAVIWAAGVRANPLTSALGVPLDAAGRVAVDADLTLAGHPEVSVIGDAAVLPDHRSTALPQVAPVAMQQGRHAAAQVLRRIEGRPTVPFRYRDRGSMATIGRNAAVNEYPMGLRLRGLPAWVAWMLLHLFYLAGYRNRLSAMLTWGWSYLTHDRSLRVVFDDPTPRRFEPRPPEPNTA